MNNPCPKRVLCPAGTGSDTAGVNYSSEHVDVPEFPSVYYPPVPGYGYYTSCQNRCMSLISQQDADLCAQRLGKICLNEQTHDGPGDKPKQTFGNTPQICNEPNTGRLVIIPADTFLADSVAEANAQALSAANKAQKDPNTPSGPSGPPPPNPNPPPVITINTIPTPQLPHPKPPTPPPASQCKPCDDTTGAGSFSIPFDIPDGGAAQGPVYSPPIKCGVWRFWIETNVAAPQSVQNFVTATLVASDPAHTLVDSGSLTNCPQMAWVAPCGHGGACDPQNVGEYGIFPGCCDVNFFDCLYAECQTIGGQHYLVEVMLYFVPGDPLVELAHQFTFKGQWTGPLPPP